MLGLTHVVVIWINLTEVVLTHDQRSLLNLGPKFVPTKKSVALNLEYHNKEADAESLHQNVRHIPNKTWKSKITFQKNNGKH